MKYYVKSWRIVLFLFVISFFLIHGFPYSFAQGKKKSEEGKKKAELEVHGVAIVSMDAPLRANIGKKVNIELVIGNERATKVTTILTVDCLTTKQQIGREAETLDGLSSQKIIYSWDTQGLKEGTYVIRAVLEKVPDETDVDDNVRQLDVVLVR